MRLVRDSAGSGFPLWGSGPGRAGCCAKRASPRSGSARSSGRLRRSSSIPVGSAPATLSHVCAPQDLRGALVEAFAAAHLLEAGEQVAGAQAALLRAAEVVQDATAIEHQQAEIGRAHV